MGRRNGCSTCFPSRVVTAYTAATHIETEVTFPTPSNSGRLDATGIRALLCDPESDCLDFKQKMFPVKGGTDESKAELIKDILAFANTPRSAPAYILYGVAHEGGTAKLVGLSGPPRDDADFQSLFRYKTNRPPRFHYYEVDVDGLRVGVFDIPASQARPLYLTTEYGRLREHAIYVRRGSSTDTMPPDEWLRLAPPRSDRPRPTQPPPAGGEIEALVKRWWSIFDGHGVLRNQIPALLPQFTLPLSALASWPETVDLLTPDVLDATCRLFNVRRPWLDGEDRRIYEAITLDRHLHYFLKTLLAWRKETEEVTLIVMRDGKRPLHEEYRQAGGLLLRAQAWELGEKQVFRYAPVVDFGGWGWEAHRLLAKAAILAAVKLECWVFGRVMPRRDIERIAGEEAFPESLVGNPCRQDWYPDEFVYRPQESMVAKDPDELETVYRLMEKGGMLEVLRQARASLGLAGDYPRDLPGESEWGSPPK